MKLSGVIAVSPHAKERYAERVPSRQPHSKKKIRSQVQESTVVSIRKINYRGHREVKAYLRHANGLEFVLRANRDGWTIKTVYWWDREREAMVEKVAKLPPPDATPPNSQD